MPLLIILFFIIEFLIIFIGYNIFDRKNLKYSKLFKIYIMTILGYFVSGIASGVIINFSRHFIRMNLASTDIFALIVFIIFFIIYSYLLFNKVFKLNNKFVAFLIISLPTFNIFFLFWLLVISFEPRLTI
jgi:hypothetical protein